MSDCSCKTHDVKKALDPADPSRYFDVFEVLGAQEIKFRKATEHKIVREFTFQGLPISIETDKGQYREYRGGKVKMNYPYGFIRRTTGADGEEIDVYVGPNKESQQVFVIHQRKKPSFDNYDEDKVMVGFESPREAKAAYLEHYDDRRFFGTMTETTIDDFKRIFMKSIDVDKLTDGLHKRKPYLKNKSMDAGLVGTPPPPPMPMVPPMGMPGMGMMGMMPPPTDVETFEGVQALLGRIGTIADQQLMEIASLIWGNGYMFQGMPPDQARQEIIGFLLDQRDLLGVAPEPTALQPSGASPVSGLPGSSDYSNVSTTSQIAAPPVAPVAPSSAMASPPPSFENWFARAF